MKKKIYFGWYVAGVGTLSLLFAYGVRAVFAIFFPYILRDLQMSRALISGAVSLSLFVNLLLTPIAGYAVDKYGPRWLIISGSLFCGISLMCMPLVSKLWHLYLLYGITFAIGVNLMGLTVNNSMCVNWFIKYRATAIAITSAGGGIGAAIFNPMSQTLISTYGWRMAFAGIGVVTMVVMIPMALIFARKRPEDMGLYTDGDNPEDAKKAAAFVEMFMKSEISFTAKEFFAMPAFWLIGMGWLIMALYAGFGIHIVAYCMERGIEAAQAAWALGIGALVAIGSRFIWGPVNDYFKNRKISCIAGLLVGAVCVTGLLFIQKPIHFYIFAFVAAFGGSGVALLPALIGDQFGRLSMGRVYGFINVFGAAGGAIGPILAGWIYDTYQSYNLAWELSIGLHLVAATCFILVGKSPYEVRKAAQIAEGQAAQAAAQK